MRAAGIGPELAIGQRITMLSDGERWLTAKLPIPEEDYAAAPYEGAIFYVDDYVLGEADGGKK